MIVESIKLMILGMVIVYLFLIALMVSVIISAKLFKGHTSALSSNRVSVKKTDYNLIAAISAAVSAYRYKNTKK